MFELLEEAEDRAVLARFYTICPLMPKSEAQDLWDHLLKTLRRDEIRAWLTRCFDVHDASVARGEPGFFHPNGDIVD
jgi:hypothetical protein